MERLHGEVFALTSKPGGQKEEVGHLAPLASEFKAMEADQCGIQGRDSDGKAVVSCTSFLTPESRPCPLQGPSTPVSEETSSSRVLGTTGRLEARVLESHSWKTKLSAHQIVNGFSLELWTRGPDVSQQA